MRLEELVAEVVEVGGLPVVWPGEEGDRLVDGGGGQGGGELPGAKGEAAVIFPHFNSWLFLLLLLL